MARRSALVWFFVLVPLAFVPLACRKPALIEPQPFPLQWQGSISMKAGDGGVVCLGFSPDGKLLATGSFSGDVFFWDVATGQEKLRLPKHPHQVISVAFSRDGQTFVSTSLDGTTHMWDVPGGKPRPTTLKARAAAFSADGTTLVAVLGGLHEKGADVTLRVHDLRSGKDKDVPLEASDFIFRPVFSPDCKSMGFLLDERPAVGDTQTGKIIARLDGPHGSFQDLAFHPDGKKLVSAGKDFVLRVWEIDTGKELAALRAGELTAVAVSPDGGTLASGTMAGALKLWNLPAAEGRLRLKAKHLATASLAFSPDGTLLAAGDGGSSTVRLWEVVRESDHDALRTFKPFIEERIKALRALGDEKGRSLKDFTYDVIRSGEPQATYKGQLTFLSARADYEFRNGDWKYVGTNLRNAGEFGLGLDPDVVIDRFK